MLNYLLKLDIITNLFFFVNPSYFLFSSPSLIFSSTPLFSQHIPVPRESFQTTSFEIPVYLNINVEFFIVLKF